MREIRNQGKRVRQGVLWLSLCVAAALAIFFADRLSHVGRDTFEIVAVFPEATRLREDGAVWVAGNAVGRIRSVGFMPASRDTLKRLAVVLEIPEDIRALLTRDALPMLRTPRLFADQVVDLVPGDRNAPALQAGDTLLGWSPPTMIDLMDRANRLRIAADSLMASAFALNNLGEQHATGPAFVRVQRNLELLSDEFAVMSNGSENGSLRAFLADSEGRAALGRVRESVGAIRQGFERLRAARETGAPADAYTRLMRHVTELQAQFALLEALAATPNGTAGRLMGDSALAVAVRGARAQMDSLMVEARSNPFRFVF